MIDTVRVIAKRRYGTVSPLRYPGGKASLAGLFEDILEELDLSSPTYIEPYAGGAGAGIALLRQGLIERLVINDIDPAVYAFWASVVAHTEEFVQKVSDTPLTVEEWRRQKAIYNDGAEASLLELGFAFFYLNRTNRSGILNAGVIGGLAQSGNYKIDARFNRKTLVERIYAIGGLADRIDVLDLDGRTVIRRFSSNPNTFLYIDPPYVDAGSKLYLNAFEARDHTALSEIVLTVDQAHWLLTYDKSSFIQKLYSSEHQCLLDLTYSANRTGNAQELMVASPGVAEILRSLHKGGVDAEEAG